jgi:hypothetical protein
MPIEHQQCDQRPARYTLPPGWPQTAAETTSHLGYPNVPTARSSRPRSCHVLNLAIDSKLRGSCRCFPPMA